MEHKFLNALFKWNSLYGYFTETKSLGSAVKQILFTDKYTEIMFSFNFFFFVNKGNKSIGCNKKCHKESAQCESIAHLTYQMYILIKHCWKWLFKERKE